MRRSLIADSARPCRARARFHSALELGLLGLLVALSAPRTSGAETPDAAEPRVGAAEPRGGAAELKSPDSGTRYRAAEALGQAKASSAAPDLRAAIKAEKIPAARQAMIEALGLIGDRSSAPFLLELALKDPEEGSRLSAMVALHRMGDVKSWDKLEALVADPAQPKNVRRTALALIGANKGEKAVKTLKAAAHDPSPELRREALHALARVDTEEAKREIRGAAADPDDGVREAAARILARSRKKGGELKGK